jgi:signal transduction histidine kinase
MSTARDEELIEIAAELVPLAADGCTIDLFERTRVVCAAACHIDPSAARDLYLVDGRGGHSAVARCSIVSGESTIGEVVAWGARSLPPVGEALLRSLAGKVAIVVEARRDRRRAREVEARLASTVAMVGHEVRAPLQALTVGIDLVHMRARDATDEIPRAWVLERCEQLAKSLTRLNDVAGRLLDVSRLESGVERLDPADEDLRAVVEGVVARLREQAEWTGSPIVIEQDGPQRGCWDRLQLETIVENLLTNAMKYGAGRRIHVTIRGRQNDVRLEVRDQGCGIQPDDMGRVFERFYRGRVPGHHAGLGVGLWIVKRLADAQGGSVECESTPGEGATFIVTLPRDVSRADRVRERSESPREAPPR